jgi:hypothetical protein
LNSIDAFPIWFNSSCALPSGCGQISGTSVALQHAIVLGPGDHLTAAAATAAAAPQGSDPTAADADGFSSAAADHGLKFLLMAGAPINEPIVQHG